MKSETHGSQYLLRVAVNKRPELLRYALRESDGLGRRECLVSPLEMQWRGWLWIALLVVLIILAAWH
jgi:hypothetical protein